MNNSSQLLLTCSTDIIERLSMIDTNFERILDIGSRFGQLLYQLKNTYPLASITSTDLSQKMCDDLDHTNKICVDDELIDFPNQSFDLITFSFGLHTILDIKNFLIRIKDILTEDGVFIGNFIGDGSLNSLRQKFIMLESMNNQLHYHHVSPFINFDNIMQLFQLAGFAEVIVDKEVISLEYTNMLALMRDIKNIGEANILKRENNYTISKAMYKNLCDDDEVFYDKINLVTFLAVKNKKLLVRK